MKRRSVISLIIMALVTMAFLALNVTADNTIIMYTAKEKVKVYERRNLESPVIKEIKGGEKLLIEEITNNQKWVTTLLEDPDGDGQITGWIPMRDMSFTMPSSFCDHQWTEWYVIENPTCTKGGLLCRDCPVCGVGETTESQPLGHDFTGWETKKEATCTAEGERVRRCTRCGEEEKQTIEKLAHNFGDWTVLKAATCTAEGERSHKCRTCGFEEKQVIERLPHNFGEWTVLKEATCTREGERVHKCKDCGLETKGTIEKLPHTFKWEIITDATDHSAGVRTNVCQVCGYTEEQVSFDPEGTLRRGDRSEAVREVQQLLADQNYLSPDGADGIFGGGTEKAIMQFQSDRGLTPDGIAWPQTIQKLHHEFGDWEIIKEATRLEAGERVRKCTDCNYEQHEKIELTPYFERGRRGEDVRVVQQGLTQLGFDAGAYDGIYGQKLDTAFAAFAASKGLSFEPGTIVPAELDALVNAMIEQVPEDKWLVNTGLGTPVNMALTVNPILDEAAGEENDIVSCTWTLHNMGDTDCTFAGLLLNFGDDPDFREDNLIIVLDGQVLKANSANSVSGSFKVSKAWGEGNMNFCAVAIDENAGYVWLSNADVIENQTAVTEEAVETEVQTEAE